MGISAVATQVVPLLLALLEEEAAEEVGEEEAEDEGVPPESAAAVLARPAALPLSMTEESRVDATDSVNTS